MDLFEWNRRQDAQKEAPLAARMRPRNLDEVIGQEHILGPGKFLRKAILAGRLPSCIFFGPPGTGKTTLARLAANLARAHFEPLSAVSASVQDLRRVVQEARDRRGMHGQRTVLFVDEIHRWSKTQQDGLLPHVEDGELTLLGATTENPMVSVIPALVSRVRLFELKPLDDSDIRTLLERALVDAERGLGGRGITLAPDARTHLARVAGGDARTALNALELAAILAETEPGAPCTISVAAAEEAIQRQVVRFDREAGEHYHVISAFIKSIRGSDPDAAVYWLARMIYAGEDPRSIARRLIIHASEDIGLADPQAMAVAAAAAGAVEYVGLPEARIPLAEATLYLALAPKSNSSKAAIDAALARVGTGPNPPVPIHLREIGHGMDKRLGYGKGYLYPHEFPEHWVAQAYWPEGTAPEQLYRPSDQGREAGLSEELRRRRQGSGSHGASG